MYVAKMTTRYPDFHGEGYFNFLMDENEDVVNGKIEDNSHDFRHVETKYIDMEGAELMEKYPTKYDLNKGEFDV